VWFLLSKMKCTFHFGLRENEVQDSNSLHTQNRTKGDKRGTHD
jgi:hypothetical protein